MKRGEIWTIAGGKDFAGKPRPAVIIQDDNFDSTRSVAVCSFTTNEVDASLVRPVVLPDPHNGLRAPCRLMVDKITTLPRSKVGTHIGRLSDEDIRRLNQALTLFLGLAISPRFRDEAAL